MLNKMRLFILSFTLFFLGGIVLISSPLSPNLPFHVIARSTTIVGDEAIPWIQNNLNRISSIAFNAPFSKQPKSSPTIARVNNEASVLAAKALDTHFVFTVNVESFFRENAKFNKNVDIKGTLTAQNAGFTDTATADTSFLSPAFDTATGVAMNIGTVTQTALTIGRAEAATTLTGSTLSLHGATTLNNTFTISGPNLTSLGGNLTVAGTAWTATPTISGLITATSGLTTNGDLTVNKAFTLGDGEDAGSINTSDWAIDAAGVMTGISGITTNGGYTQSNTIANTFTGVSTFSNTTYSALFTGGSVGIGTTTPLAKLDVRGAGSATQPIASLSGSTTFAGL
ncbi:hypothetical protein KJ980_04430, partial [Patescibacteria group bacterium]|nr:hypothetical protein [Patescibacteria group bacterium]